MRYSERSWQELWTGIAAVNIWFKLSVLDILSRYRRTLLGPLWHVLSHAATIIGLSLLYSRVFAQDARTYLLYVTTGLTVWSLIVAPFTDASTILVRSKPLLAAYDIPISLHIMRAVAGYFLAFLHNMVVFVVVVIFSGHALNGYSLLFFPAIAVILLMATGVAMTLSVYGARYRDLAPAMTVVISIAFLLTPIFWNKAQTMGVEWVSAINPFYHLVEIARGPLLGLPPSAESWTVSIVVALVAFVVGTLSVVGNRANVTYWV